MYESGTVKIFTKYKQYIKGIILDVGCGNISYDGIIDNNSKVFGLDISSGQISKGKEVNDSINVSYILGDMRDISFPKSYFNTILSILSIVHINRVDHKKIITKFYNILKPKGYLLIHVGESDLKGVYSEFYKNKMYFSHYSSDFYSRLFHDLGFKIIDTFKKQGKVSEYRFYLLQKIA